MKAVIQRVKKAGVTVNEEVIGEIGQGYLILLGVMDGDTQQEAQTLASKTALLRVFEDEDGKMNRSILDINGEALVVSQFTLCADVRKGNRPSFTPSAKPEEANALYEYYMEKLKEQGVRKVAHGQFGADMQVSLVNDGPVTILFDTQIWSKK
ncbi:MAG: D-tyrosyl-tRNA(Tyr) deacylase [Clostridia bacterium]|nr:D-tyrosyl-tRNA(Tyr) deacylase [Clostridia bacterium]